MFELFSDKMRWTGKYSPSLRLHFTIIAIVWCNHYGGTVVLLSSSALSPSYHHHEMPPIGPIVQVARYKNMARTNLLIQFLSYNYWAFPICGVVGLACCKKVLNYDKFFNEFKNLLIILDIKNFF